MSEIDQRRHPRLPVNLPIRVWSTQGDRIREMGRMVDISEGGLCFIGARYLPPGTLVLMEFGDWKVSGEVRHCSPRNYAAHVQFVTGVKIGHVEAGIESWKNIAQMAS